MIGSAMGDWLQVALAIFSIASLLGAASGIFYGVRQNTIIQTLKESNTAYKERNEQLDATILGLEKTIKNQDTKSKEQDTKLNMLIAMKSPDLEDVKSLIKSEATRVVKEIQG